MNISAEEFHIHFISYANIPFKAGIYASDLSIDWGDGTSSILKEKQYFNIVHHYQQEGLFHIKISANTDTPTKTTDVPTSCFRKLPMA